MSNRVNSLIVLIQTLLDIDLEKEKATSFDEKWTAPSILDMRQSHFEAASKASGLIPSRCE